VKVLLRWAKAGLFDARERSVSDESRRIEDCDGIRWRLGNVSNNHSMVGMMSDPSSSWSFNGSPLT